MRSKMMRCGVGEAGRLTKFGAWCILSVLLAANSVSGYADTVEDVLKLADKYADYTSPSYDRGKAISILTRLAQKDDVSLLDKVKVFCRIAAYYDYHALPPNKKSELAMSYYRKAVELAPERFSGDLLTARVNLVSLLADEKKKLDESIKLYDWLSDILALSDKKFIQTMVQEEDDDLTPRQRSATRRNLRKRASTIRQSVARGLVKFAKSFSEPKMELRAIKERYPLGAMAAEALAQMTPEDRDDEVQAGDGKKNQVAATVTELNRLRGRGERSADILRQLVAFLSDKRDTGQNREVLVCDLAVCALNDLMYGLPSFQRNFLKKNRRHRDKAVADWLAWWHDHKDWTWTDILKENVSRAIDRLKTNQDTEFATSVLSHELGTDFAFHIRVVRGRRVQVLKEITEMWDRIKNEPPHRWSELTQEARSRARATEVAYFQESAERSKANKLRELESLQNEHPELLVFSEELWPEWRKTRAGRSKALDWLRKNASLYRDTRYAGEIETIIERLEEEIE